LPKYYIKKKLKINGEESMDVLREN